MESKKRCLRELPLGSIDEARVPLRQIGDPDKLEELRKSIKSQGVIQPVIVFESGGRFTLIDGKRRVLAARDAKLATIPAVVVTGDEEWWLIATMQSNRLREGLTPWEEGNWLQWVIEKRAFKQAKLAEMLGVSEAWISQRLAVLDWPDYMVAAQTNGNLSFAAGRELMGVKDDARRKDLVHLAVSSGCTAREAANWRKQWEDDERYKAEREAEQGKTEESIETYGDPEKCIRCHRVLGAERTLIARVCEKCGQILVAGTGEQ